MESGNEVSNLEFVISKHCSGFVKDCEVRIKKLFNVKVKLKDVTRVNDKSMQWVWVSGKTDDASKAKEYILALTSPQETVHLKDVFSHPKFTPQKENEIEKASSAVLSKIENNGLAIQGTELSVATAMSMIDDMLCEKDCDDVKEKRQEDKGKYPVIDQPGKSAKHGKSVTPLNQNNSSLTSCLSHASPHLEKSDVCYGNFAETDLSWDARQEPQAKRSLNSGRVGNNALYASASAITPTTLSSQAASPALATPFYSYSNEPYGEKYSECSVANPTFNDKGSQSVSKAGSIYPQIHPNLSYGQERHDETGMEICDTYVKPISPQAKEQQDYLKNLGLSLHYSVEDINTGLARYSMDDVIKPADFLKMLNQIKAQRHGGSLRSSMMNGNEQPKTTYPTSVSMDTNAVASKRSPAKTISSSPQAITVDSVSDLDESVICMGSVSNDAQAIYISSDNESDHSETEALVIVESRLQPQYTKPFQTEPSSSTSQSKVPYQQQYEAHQPQPQPHPQQTVPAQPPTEEWSLHRNPANSINSLPPRQTGRSDLRYIVIDGSNVAMAHGKNKVFSVEGLRICIYYFVRRGHDQITAFVPEWRRYAENKKLITNRALLEKLNGEGYVEFTPARRIAGRTIQSYDDRYCLNLAIKEDGIVVSNDQFRDLYQEQASYKDVVATRLLPFVFVNDHFMPPDDPLGRDGPHLDEFLRKPVQRPPPQGPVYNTSLSIQPPLNKPTNPVPRILAERDATKKPVKASTNRQGGDRGGKGAPLRSLAVTEQLFAQLIQVFPDPKQQQQIRSILENHKRETDLNRLTNYCANALFT